MRSVLLEWLVDVATEYHMQTSTYFLAVRLLDRVLKVPSPTSLPPLSLSRSAFLGYLSHILSVLDLFVALRAAVGFPS